MNPSTFWPEYFQVKLDKLGVMRYTLTFSGRAGFDTTKGGLIGEAGGWIRSGLSWHAENSAQTASEIMVFIRHHPSVIGEISGIFNS